MRGRGIAEGWGYCGGGTLENSRGCEGSRLMIRTFWWIVVNCDCPSWFSRKVQERIYNILCFSYHNTASKTGPHKFWVNQGYTYVSLPNLQRRRGLPPACRPQFWYWYYYLILILWPSIGHSTTHPFSTPTWLRATDIEHLKLFIYFLNFWPCWVSCCVQATLSGGLSCCRAQALKCAGFSSCSSWAHRAS